MRSALALILISFVLSSDKFDYEAEEKMSYGDLMYSLSRVPIGRRKYFHAENTGPNPLKCLATHCAGACGKCFTNKKCIQAVFCNAKCQGQPEEDGCDLLCELTYGYNNTAYTNVLKCATSNNCLPVNKNDGKCLAKDSDTVRNITTMQQVAGKWWILSGLNCGQDETWPGGFDYFPCQRDDFVLFDDDYWLDYIAYCGGKNDSCSTPIVKTVANATISAPGVMRHDYLDAPLLPQLEFWRVLSYPHPDWMLYIYCGTTPINEYAGGSVVSRASRTLADIPKWIEDIFVKKANEFGFDYYKMCVSNDTSCSD